jgi:probable rRNA maturation factor
MPAPRRAASPVAVEVVLADPRWRESLPRVRALARRAALAAIAAARADARRPHPMPRRCELTVVLADDATMKPLNKRWRGKNRPTNVLSFPSGELEGTPLVRRGAPLQLGDVILARETVEREAAAQGKPLAHHLLHLAAHGTLHLLGYDHETGPADAERMEALERALLAGLRVPDPY